MIAAALARRMLLPLAGLLLLGGMLSLARCSGARDEAIARERAAADSAGVVAALAVGRAHRASMAAGKYYRTTVPPHERSVRASDRTIARARAADSAAAAVQASGSAAVADTASSALTLRMELTRSVDMIGMLRSTVASLTDTLLFERLTAGERILAGEQLADSLRAEVGALEVLVGKRDRQLAIASRKAPWWRRALGGTCKAGVSGAAAGGGALIAGPAGAAVGAVGGLLVGALSCR